MSDPLVALSSIGQGDGLRAFFVEIVAVHWPPLGAEGPSWVTVDPHDGDLVDQVPWIGQSPQVGDQVVMLLSQGQLMVLSTGRPS